MQRISLTEDLSFSQIAYGMWRLDEAEDTSPAAVQAKIEACLEQGITTIDQADIYGLYTAEAILGAGLKGTSLRDKIELVTKCDIVVGSDRYPDVRVKHYDTSPEYIKASLDMTLKAVGVDHVDLLLVHRPDPLMRHEETGRALDDLVASGKTRSVGVSNFRPWDFSLLQTAMETDLVVNQIELSLKTHEPFVNGDVVFLQENEIAPMAWSPLGGGDLMTGTGPVQDALAAVATRDGVDAAAVATAWLLAHPAGIIPVLGTNNLTRIKTFSDALKVDMDRQTWFELYSAALGREVA
ncbi:MAG: aldo/keto reductase [Paracoccaceae bacterium]|nr:aldo/keto reductase [Paracoccaceae bacterium]